MSKSVYRAKAEHIVVRLSQLDLDNPVQKEAAVKRLTMALTNAVAGAPWAELLDKFRDWAVCEDSRLSLAYVKCAEAVEELGLKYDYPTLEDWWASTSYQDEIGVDDQVFRDKPTHLKRIALEAFNAARRASAPVDSGK